MRIAVGLVLFSGLLSAQSFQGVLRGHVADASGANVQGARVALTDEATHIVRSTLSDGAGEYVFPSVTPATYTITAEAAGFKKLERAGVGVATQASVTVDVTLEIGQVNQQVNVTEQAPELQTGDASTGQLIDSKKITDLPLLGRNPFFTGKLAQSVVFVGNPKFGRMQDQNANSQVSIAGGPVRTNNYLVDGISITDSTNRAVLVPSPEAVQELKVQASTYDAEVGRTGGGTLNMFLRSGTNDLHGSAVGHIRQTDWLANNFFANRAGQPVADQPFRDWAFSLGGPVVVPKLYNGRSKTFFFITTEAYRQSDGATYLLSVPTALEKQGDFSQSFARSGALQTIYDPFTTAANGTRQPFTSNGRQNVIPASRLNPVGVAIASYYPNPNLPTPYYGAPNYSYTGSYPNRGDQSTWKLDHEFASWLRASGSYIHQKTFETDGPSNIFPNPATPNQNYCCDRKIDATQANATIVPDAATVVTVRWGFNRFYSRSTQASAGFNLASLGLPASLAAETPNPAFPAITMSDLSSYGGGGANQDVYYSRSFNVTASRFLGRHTVKAGFDFRTLHDFGTPLAGPSSFGFSTLFTQANPLFTTAGTGASLATLLLGYPTSGSMNVVTSFDDYVRYYAGFVHDDFRVTQKFTINFGLRLEHETGIREQDNKLITGFNANAASPLNLAINGQPVRGEVLYAGVNGNPSQTGDPRSIKPAPRFGFAYNWNDKTVIRGGYGIYWAPNFFNFQNAIGYSQTTSIITSTDGGFTPASTLSNPYPNGLLQPTGNTLGGLSGIGQAITVFSPSTQSSGYVQQYSLEVQRQIPAGFVITVGALGSHSLHLLENGQNIDQLDPAYFALGPALSRKVANPFYGRGGVGTVGTPTISQAQLLSPFPQYTSVTLQNSDSAASRYYSFYIRGERRFANGLSLLASYTWSRSTDDVVGLNLAGTSQITSPSGPQNAYNLGAEWSLSTQDVPNRFTSAITYELPFGYNKRFLGGNRWLDLAVGGWSLNAFGVIQSGYPLSITQPNNNAVTGASYQRPNATGISPVTHGSVDDRINGWLNPAAFSEAPAFTFGNLSRFIDARGPGLFNWDLSIFKTFSIRERIRAQFRAEALNATNTPYFAVPNTTLTNSQFGLITSQINNPRMLQLGTRITF